MKNPEEKKFEKSLIIPLSIIGLMWLVHLLQVPIEALLGHDIGRLGIYPRRMFGLKGILFTPFIHSDYGHLISNSVPMLALGTMIYYFYRTIATKSLVMIYLLTGIAVWLMARSVFHVGMSGVVYGLISFVCFVGIFRRNVKSIVLALIVTVIYSGSLFSGILPNQEGISWESHLFGALVGIFTAFFYRDEIEEDEVEHITFDKELPKELRPFFLNRDIFDKTKEERRREQEEAKDYPDWYTNNSGDY